MTKNSAVQYTSPDLLVVLNNPGKETAVAILLACSIAATALVAYLDLA